MKILVSGLTLTMVLFGASAWASAPKKPAKTSSAPKVTERILFPSRLDGFTSSNPGFRFIQRPGLKTLPGLNDSSLVYLSSISPNLLSPAPTENLAGPAINHHSSQKKILSKNLSLETNYADKEKPGPKTLSDLEYGKLLKESSVGIAYWLTPNFILNGRYAEIKKAGSDPQLTPSLGATYRLNTRTSISLSYQQPSVSGKPAVPSSDPNATAELKVHF